MAFARKNFAVLDYDNISVIDGATVTVRLETPGQPLAALKSDRDGTSMANPYVAADGADAGFYCAGAAVQITATKDAFTRTWRYEPVGTAQEYDIDSLVALVGASATASLGAFPWIDNRVLTGDIESRETATATMIQIASAIKDIAILNGDPGESYFVAVVCNQDATFDNQIWINKLSDGSNVAIAEPLEVDRVGVTVLEFGSAPRVKLAINYSELPGTGVLLNSATSPLVIRNPPEGYVSEFFLGALEKLRASASNPMLGEDVVIAPADSEFWGAGATGESTHLPNTGALTDARNNFDAPSVANKLAKYLGQLFCNGEGYSITDPVSAAYAAGTREYRKTLNVDVCNDPQFVVIDTATGLPAAKTITTEAGAVLGKTLDLQPGQSLLFRHVGDWWKLIFTTQDVTSTAGLRPVVTLRGKLNAGSANSVTTYEATPSNGNEENFYVGLDDWRVTISNPALGAELRIECIENHRAVIIRNNALYGTWSGQWLPGTGNFTNGIPTTATTVICGVGKNDRILASVGSTTGPDNPLRTRDNLKAIVVGIWDEKPLADVILTTGSKTFGLKEVTGDPATYGFSMAEVSAAARAVAMECDLDLVDYYAVSAANDIPALVSDGTTTNASTAVTGISTTAALRDGMVVRGTGVPAGATIRVTGSTTVELSLAATASATVSLTFAAKRSADDLHANDAGHHDWFRAFIEPLGAQADHYASKNQASTAGFTMAGTIDMATQQLLLGGSSGGKLYDNGSTRTLLHAKGDRFDVVSQDGLSAILQLTLTNQFPLIKGAEMVWSRTNNVTAFAGGGQASATLLASRINRVSTVASAADSVKLPVTTLGFGLWCVVINSAANSLQVFGSGTDTINGVATATGVAVAAGKVGIYFSTASGVWFGGTLA